MQEISVFRRPKIAYFSNGDELKAAGNALEIGEVYDSNRYTLHAMLSALRVVQYDLGIIKDDPEAIAQSFKRAAEDADLVITTAGASVGDADYVKQTLADLGEISFWKVAVKPGRPMSFGKLNNSLFLVYRAIRSRSWSLPDFCQTSNQAIIRRKPQCPADTQSQNPQQLKKTSRAHGISTWLPVFGRKRRNRGQLHRRTRLGNFKLHESGKLLHHSSR